MTVQQQADLLSEVYTPISSEAGRLLHALVRAVKPTTVVDIHASHAISIIHVAAAVRNNTRSREVTIKLSAEKAQRARANLTEGGLSDVVTVQENDVLETLADAPASIDELLLGVGKDLSKRQLRLRTRYQQATRNA